MLNLEEKWKIVTKMKICNPWIGVGIISYAVVGVKISDGRVAFGVISAVEIGWTQKEKI